MFKYKLYNLHILTYNNNKYKNNKYKNKNNKYKNISNYNKNDLHKLFIDSYFKNIRIKTNLWKPQIIKQYIDKLPDNDIVIFFDKNYKYKKIKIKKYLNILKNNNIFIYTKKTNKKIIKYAKNDLFDKLNYNINKNKYNYILSTNFLIILLNDNSRNLIGDWAYYCNINSNNIDNLVYNYKYYEKCIFTILNNIYNN